MVNLDYPKDWNQLPRHERRKKIKALRREHENKTERVKRFYNWGLVFVVLLIGFFAYAKLARESSKQIESERQIKPVSLSGKEKEFHMEGKDNVSPQDDVKYKTTPPTSGGHLAQAENWGVFDKEIDDKAAVHNLEHGGVWISYKSISAEEKKILEEIGKENPQSVIVSPRLVNDSKIAVVSWGRIMKLKSADKALIQKYINTYKNQSPEKLAR